MNFYTYIYTDPERNIPIYVGKGNGLRAFDHLKEVKKNSRFKNRMKTLKKLGLVPLIEIFDMPNEDCAFLAEIELIAFFGRKDLQKGTLYNMTDGGEGASGIVWSEDRKKKHAESVKASYTPELRATRTEQFKNQIFTEQHCKNLSLAKTGTVRSEKSKLRQGKTLRGGNHVKCKLWTLQSPTGEVFKTKDMTTFCTERKLNYSSLRNRAREQSHEPLGKGDCKGWIVISCA